MKINLLFYPEPYPWVD